MKTINGYIIGPKANLQGSNLRETNLLGLIFRGLRVSSLSGLLVNINV